MAEGREFIVTCWHCTARFDAFEACFCSHIDPTKICPFCLHCSCDAPEAYKRDFIQRSPLELLEEKAALQSGRDLKLGELLLKSGKITRDQLNIAVARQVTENKMLGEILIDMRIITLRELLFILADQKGIDEIDLSEYEIDFELVDKIGKEFCLDQEMIPIELFQSSQVKFFRFAISSKANLLKVKEKIKENNLLRGCNLIPYMAKKEVIEVLLEEIRLNDTLMLT